MEIEYTNAPRVLVTTPNLPQSAIDLLLMSCQVKFCEHIPATLADIQANKGMDAILWADNYEINADILNAAGEHLKVISLMAPDYDFVDLNEIKSRGILLGYTPTIVDEAIANCAIALLIASSRRFYEGRKKIDENNCQHSSLKWLFGNDIHNSTIGLVGYGRIGQKLAKRLINFKPKEILFYSDEEIPYELNEYHAIKVHFVELVQKSDSIIVSCALRHDTRNLFNEETFSKMKTNCVLINVSKRGIIDEKALYDALKENRIFGAGIDICNQEPMTHYDPLLQLDNCFITPNLAVATCRTRENMSIIAAHNILRALDGEEMFATATFE